MLRTTRTNSGTREIRIAGRAAPDSSSSLREVEPSCGTCACARRLRHNESTGAGRHCEKCGPAPRPRVFPWPPRRGRLRRRRRRDGQVYTARSQRRFGALSRTSLFRTLSRILIAHFPGRVVRREFREDYGHHGPLGEGDNYLLGRVRQQIGPLLLGFF